jgi:alpha-L-fucosidase
MMGIIYVLLTLLAIWTGHKHILTKIDHTPPEWFVDSKFGIMIHYGVYSEIGWAPPISPQNGILNTQFYCQNPYAAWYQNSMMIPNCSTYTYHLQKYGPNVTYWDFKTVFDIESKKLNITHHWLNPIIQSMAKYVVLVAKHHDGMTLWNSGRKSAEIDIIHNYVNEMAKTSLIMGLYYSGGFDWSFSNVSSTKYINSTFDAVLSIPQSTEYANTVVSDYLHLIDTYKPKYLWNDIALPLKVDIQHILQHYNKVVPDGAMNDRKSKFFGIAFINVINEWTLWFRQNFIEDFAIRSLEYLEIYPKSQYYWEADRGAGWDFSYNVNDYSNHTWSPKEAIDFIIQASANNGNLLLGIAPFANGSLPSHQIELLQGIGSWLSIYGTTIFKTRPIFEDLHLHWTSTNKEWNVFIPCCNLSITLLRQDIPSLIPSIFTITTLEDTCDFTSDSFGINIDLNCLTDSRSKYVNYSIPLTFRGI